ncbi:hypothetical protein FQA39_LY03148 [Lamprigera yunnana]|nr:hypothetical protein FQA39_LY03148 [Lamprigera yunnana]
MNLKNDKKYFYTKNSVYLTDQQRQFYEDNGYIVIKNLVDAKLLDECRERFLEFCNNRTPDIKVMTTMKDPHLKSKNVKGEFVINKIQDILFDEVFFKLVSYKPIVDIVESIIGPNITAFHSMLINKPPNTTIDHSRHPLHQDLHYLPFRPANSIVTAWTAMEHINERNGCLFVVPGSHKLALYKHGYPPNVINFAFHGAIGCDNVETVNLEMEKGDTVFFHPLLLHGSGPNLTKGFRKAISSGYADSNCHFINLKGTIQEKVGKEIERIGQAGGFKTTTIYKYFKSKSVLLRGKPGNYQKFDSNL